MSKVLEAASWEGRIFSGGWTTGAGAEIEVLDKATDEVLAVVGSAAPEDVRQAGEMATRAQLVWAPTPGKEKSRILRLAAALFEERTEEITEWILRETGGIRPKAAFEINYAIDRLYATSAMCTQSYGELVAPTDPEQTSIAQRVPVGVVGQITPWNAPLALGLRGLAPALALGNAVLLKPDPQTPVSGGFLIAEILAEAGLPEGLIHVLPGGPEIGESVVLDPSVAMVTFTGSSRVGRRVGALAGGALKRGALELGGNNAIVILDDAH